MEGRKDLSQETKISVTACSPRAVDGEACGEGGQMCSRYGFQEADKKGGKRKNGEDVGERERGEKGRGEETELFPPLFMYPTRWGEKSLSLEAG